MERRVLTKETIERFNQYLLNEERSKNTVEKYIRDVKAFMAFADGNEIDKDFVVVYKQKLIGDGYAVRSINSILASINSLFAFLGWYDCKVKALKLQREIYCSEEKELTKAEYLRLVNTAKEKKNERWALILQTICGTGIRVSELQFITVEAVKRGYAKVNCKGKLRTVIIVSSLQKKLLKYAQRHHINNGTIFITRTGKPMNRTNIWREMKKLCLDANVNPSKVFPHNLRHLLPARFTASRRISPSLPTSSATAASIPQEYISYQPAKNIAGGWRICGW